MRILKPAPAITGPQLREFRRTLGWYQQRFARLLGVSKPYVQKIESSPAPIPQVIAERVYAASRVKLVLLQIKKELASQPPPRFHDFRRSRNFSTKPPFQTLPKCRCGHPRCHLSPLRDVDLPSKVHVWKFQGIRCRLINYVSKRGSPIHVSYRHH